MWSVLRKHILIPDQPRLEWVSRNATPNPDLGTYGSLYTFDRVPESTAIIRPYQLPQTPGVWYLPDGLIEGTQSRVGAVCVAWTSNGYAVTAGPQPSQYLHIKLGTRFGVRLTAQPRPPVPYSLGSLQGHIGLTGPYGLFELFDGNTPVRSCINNSARMDQSSFHAIVAGFVRINGSMRFLAWMSQHNADDLQDPSNNHYSGMWYHSSFGAGTVLLQYELDEEEEANVCDGPVTITWPTQDHSITLHLAAEKVGPWDSHELAFPVSNQQLLSNAGSTMASLRHRHTNFLAPAQQLRNMEWARIGLDGERYSAVPNLDLHGFTETFRRTVQSPPQSMQLVWFGACMGYAHNAVASWLPPGTVSNLHHDSAVNQRLSALTFRAISLTASSLDGTIANRTQAMQPLSSDASYSRPWVNPLNEYSTLIDNINVPITNRPAGVSQSLSALVSLYRKDIISPWNPSSYAEVSLQTQFALRISLCVFDSGFNPASVKSEHVTGLTDQQAEQLFAGQAVTFDIGDTNTYGPIRGTFSVQATG